MTKREFRALAAFMVFGLIVVLVSAFCASNSAKAGNGNWWTVAEKVDNYDPVRGVCDERTGNLIYETSSRYVSIITVVPGGCAGAHPLRQGETPTPTPTPVPQPPPM